MFNLLVKLGGWSKSGKDELDQSRVITRTDQHLIQQFKPQQGLRVAELKKLPTVFAPEISSRASDDQLARFGRLTDIAIRDTKVHISYTIDASIRPLHVLTIESELTDSWHFQKWELTNTHWAVKDVDLYKSLLPVYMNQGFRRPTVFQLPEIAEKRRSLVAVMMPINPAFNQVYETIRDATSLMNLECQRADDIWESQTVMQDVVSLIARARLVIVDCTNANPNVFYEMGIAHALGQDVVPITQSNSDVPFDISHLRYLKYLDNSEGRQQLRQDLTRRIETILSS